MPNHQLEVMGREVSLFYKPFFSKKDITDFLEEVEFEGYSVQEYCDLEAMYGISYSNIYYISVNRDNEEIDKFDPTRKRNHDSLEIQFSDTDDFGAGGDLIGFLYMASYQKALFNADIDINEYSRDNFFIENSVYLCKYDQGEEAYDKHVLASISYDDEEIYFQPEPTDGSYEITFAVKDNGEFEELDVYGEVSDILDELENFSIDNS